MINFLKSRTLLLIILGLFSLSSTSTQAQECTDTILDNTPNLKTHFDVEFNDQTRTVSVLASNPQDGTFTRTFQSNDAAVVDKRTKLMWQRCPYPQLHDTFPNANQGRCFFNDTDRVDIDDFDEDEDFLFSYQETIDIVNELNGINYIGFNDWRLPNIKELFSLVSSRCSDPALNEELFPNNPIDSENTCYWSSTPDRYDDPITFYHWVVNFKDGTIDRKVGTPLIPADTCHVRLVRDAN